MGTGGETCPTLRRRSSRPGAPRALRTAPGRQPGAETHLRSCNLTTMQHPPSSNMLLAADSAVAARFAAAEGPAVPPSLKSCDSPLPACTKALLLQHLLLTHAGWLEAAFDFIRTTLVAIRIVTMSIALRKKQVERDAKLCDACMLRVALLRAGGGD